MHQHDRIQHHFNSHPHEEDAPLPRLYIHRSVISTHILTKRMTMFWLNSMDVEFISTHILTKRMTNVVKDIVLKSNISTHILTKRMTDMFNFLFQDRNISTHILTKRMTLPQFLHSLPDLYFNSHPHEEDDSNFKQK